MVKAPSRVSRVPLARQATIDTRSLSTAQRLRSQLINRQTAQAAPSCVALQQAQLAVAQSALNLTEQGRRKHALRETAWERGHNVGGRQKSWKMAKAPRLPNGVKQSVMQGQLGRIHHRSM